MNSPLLWRTTWTESSSAGVVGWFLAMVLIPGFFLFLWHIATPTNGWVMTFPQMVGFFLFFPYACIVTIVFLFRLFSGGSTHAASLSLARRGEESDAYRINERWS